MGESIEYTHDGQRYVGYLALPDRGDDERRPGVLICHEGPGMNDHPRQRADRLAAEFGYVAFALDYWGDGKALSEAEINDKMWPAIQDPSSMRAVAEAGLAQLLAQPRVDASRIGAMGYCFGGSLAIELARGGEDLRGVVGFHSGLGNPHPEASSAITAKVLVILGVDDPIIPSEARLAWEQEMSAAGVDWQMLLFSGAGHSFTNVNSKRPGFEYHEPSDRRSWIAMADFWREVFV
mgnify:CR=1 FL=1